MGFLGFQREFDHEIQWSSLVVIRTSDVLKFIGRLTPTVVWNILCTFTQRVFT